MSAKPHHSRHRRTHRSPRRPLRWVWLLREGVLRASCTTFPASIRPQAETYGHALRTLDRRNGETDRNCRGLGSTEDAHSCTCNGITPASKSLIASIWHNRLGHREGIFPRTRHKSGITKRRSFEVTRVSGARKFSRLSGVRKQKLPTLSANHQNADTGSVCNEHVEEWGEHGSYGRSLKRV